MNIPYAFDNPFRETLETEFSRVFAVIRKEAESTFPPFVFFKCFMMLGLLPVDTAVFDSQEKVIMDYFDIGFQNRRAHTSLSVDDVSLNKKKLFSLYLRRIRNNCFSGKFYCIYRDHLCNPIVQTVDRTGLVVHKTIQNLKDDLIRSEDYSTQELSEIIQYQLLGIDHGECSIFCPIAMEETMEAVKTESNNILYTIVGVVKREHSFEWLKKLTDSVSQLERLYSPVTLHIFRRALLVKNWKFQSASLKSAIGSIMSRNGSHNIGSHVLAALSHNVGTMPEDRKLYQYIQHRMDYIATATTDFPMWRQPTMLVSDMMRTFLSQTHLLNYISGSEGLKAYQFQPVERVGQDQTIKLNVRRVSEWERNPKEKADGKNHGAEDGIDGHPIIYKDDKDPDAYKGINDFIIYKEDETSKTTKRNRATFDQDLSVAIPGGVVGQHAFFTILENIIRNAAKHEWSKADHKEESNLEVYVDFRDNPQDGIVEMLVWNDRVGTATSGMAEIVENLTKKIERSFISPDSGELVRENWGLAEMRISAGYLKNAGIEMIGGIGDQQRAAIKLVRPVVVRHGEKECLGFRFNFLKPKELLVVIPDLPDSAKDDLKSINGMLSRYGIELMRLDEAITSKGLAFSYVLIKGFDFSSSENKWPKLPFRVLSPDVGGNGKETVLGRRIAYYDPLSNRDIYALENGEDWSAKIKSLASDCKDGEKAKTFAHGLLEDIYASWVNHVRKGKGPTVSKKSLLIVDVEGDQKGGAKSLVTDSDLIHFVFEHSFNSAVRGYLKTVEMENKDRISLRLAGALYSLITLESKNVMSVEKFAKCGDNVSKIATQLIQFARDGLKILPETIENNKKDKEGNFLAGRWRDKLKGLKTLDCMRYLKFGCDNMVGARDKYPDVQLFIDYLCNVALEQARSFLSRYEERVVTLPPAFGVVTNEEKPNGNSQIGREFLWNNGDETILTALFTSDRGAAKRKLNLSQQIFGLCYLRHGDSDVNATADASSDQPAGTMSKQSPSLKDSSFYFEPLSGAQSYLSSLIALHRNVMHLPLKESDQRLSVIREITGLVENAVMQILLVDERATKFAEEHTEVAQIFKDTGIFVCDENNPAIAGFANNPPTFESLGISEKTGETISAINFDVVIIHQGIIDKILGDHTQERVDNFLRSVTGVFPYVVVTTGRGTPANIPGTARVLPFSVVESTLFKRYPEKMLLVDTIMNILPGKDDER